MSEINLHGAIKVITQCRKRVRPECEFLLKMRETCVRLIVFHETSAINVTSSASLTYITMTKLLDDDWLRDVQLSH